MSKTRLDSGFVPKGGDDDRAIHRAGILDYETDKPIVDSVNFTVGILTQICSFFTFEEVMSEH